MTTYDTIFSIANTLALAAWVLLIVFPRTRVTQWVVYRLGLPLVFAAAYAVLLASAREAFAAGGGFGSLTQVRVLFSYPGALLAGWLHYLAFDLFVGSRISRDSQRRGLRPWMVAPALVLTFMAGPMGMLVYAVQRRWWRTLPVQARG